MEQEIIKMVEQATGEKVVKAYRIGICLWQVEVETGNIYHVS